MSNEVEAIAAVKAESVESRALRYGVTMPQMMFVLDYITDFNCSRAYLNTLGDTDGTQVNDARLFGKMELSKPEVAKAISSEITYLGSQLCLKRETLMARAWAEALEPANKAGERLKALELLAKMIGASDFNPDEGKDKGPRLTITINDPKNITTKVEKPTGEVETINAHLGPDDTVEITQ